MKHVKDLARATRVEMYADWLAHDIDGLTFQLTYPGAGQIDGATAILADAREKIAGALAQIDNAIAADRAANNQEHA